MTPIILKGKYQDVYHGFPIEIEWELPIEKLTDFDRFRAIAEEMRRIAYNLCEAEKREAKHRRQLRLQESALECLRWLFLSPLEVTVNGKPVVEQLRLGSKKVKPWP